MSEVAVKADRLVLGYGGAVALAESDFEIPRPGITAVIGPNGSGKSTLLSAIAGLLSPMSGSITFPESSPDRPQLSYVLQTTKVNDALPVTVEEVVRMGRYSSVGRFKRLSLSDKRAIGSAMKRAGVKDFRNKHLHTLSGGQRQRAFIAQGLAQEHRLLLLDEPLSGIDLPTARAIDEVIHAETSDGCAVVLTTHDLSEASVADHVILLAGRVIAQGPPDEVLTTENLIEAYGASVLHPGKPQLIDDPGHTGEEPRHLYRSALHPEANPGDHHPG